MLYACSARDPLPSLDRLREYAVTGGWSPYAECADTCPASRHRDARPGWRRAAALLARGEAGHLLAPDERQLAYVACERMPLRWWLLRAGVRAHYLRAEPVVATGTAALSAVCDRVLACAPGPLSGRDWTVLCEGLPVLADEVRRLAPTAHPAVYAVGEARRKLAYAPDVPAAPYAEKLARCVRALLRHRADLTGSPD